MEQTKHVLGSCFPRKNEIHLSEEEDEDETAPLFPCCSLWPRKRKVDGLIRLPEGTLDHYLDPSSPINIENLLAEQELHYETNRKSAISHSLMEEEDAQFLSEHRISAILVERPKLSSAFTFDTGGQSAEELMEVVCPVSSTSASTISSRVFAIKVQPQEENSVELPYKVMDDDDQASLSSSFSQSSPSSQIPSGSSAMATTNTLNRAQDFPATTLTRTPYQPPAPPSINPTTVLQHDNIPEPIHTTSSAALLNPIPTQPNMTRRPSVVAAAQSLLGDKLDDFTEKLAFIKKNIIMSLDSEDEEELTQPNNHYYNSDGPSNLPPSRTHAVPLVVTRKENRSRSSSNASSVSNGYISDEDPAFDFKKVVELSKNVRTFSEGVMGNGLRMFNQFSTRIKNANQESR